MSGAHQGDNLAAALTTTLLVDEAAYAHLEDLAAATAGCRARGRLERLAEEPDVVVDVGHNPLAAEVIRNYLEELGRPTCRAVLGMLRDKDVEGVVQTLAGHVAEWYCAGLESERGQSGEQLAARLSAELPNARVHICPTVSLALDSARRDAREDDLVLAFGSFVTAGEAISHIEAS
jgi:dihydrofolate synthase/folylpolyglutamate synthase